MALPVIDLNQLPNPEELKKLREASEEWGCFRLVNHNIPLTLMSEMKMAVRSLLDQPLEIKQKNCDVIFGTGYKLPNKDGPLLEALGLYDCASSEAIQTFCSLLDATSDQRSVIEKYAAAIYELTEKLAENLGVKSDLREWACFFRFNKYLFSPESIGSIGVNTHADPGFLTILQADEEVGGLEVMDKSGVFVPVDPCPGTLLVNLGDMAKVWSNGRLRNVMHRVQCKEATIRVSIASFLLGPKEEAVEPPPEFVDSEHPRLYVPFTHVELRKLRGTTDQTGEALELLRIKS